MYKNVYLLLTTYIFRVKRTNYCICICMGISSVLVVSENQKEHRDKTASQVRNHRNLLKMLAIA